MSSNTTSDAVRGTDVLLSSTGLAVASFWVLLGLVYVIPSPLSRLLRSKVDSAGRAAPAIPAARTAPAPRADDDQAPRPPQHDTPAAGGAASSARSTHGGGSASAAASKNPDLVEPLQDPKHALARFAKALARTKRKVAGAITRVTHFGDSLIDLDHISAPLRHIYQQRYGNAGPGFTLGAKPWPWYNQTGLVHSNGSTWKTYRLAGGTRPDYRLGIGGAAAELPSGGGWLRIRSTSSVQFSRLDLYTMRQAGGGTITVRVDGKRLGTVNTRGTPRAPAFNAFSFADGSHRLSLAARGHVRVFGAVLERAGPGVVWDNLPMVSVRFHLLSRLDKKFFVGQLKHRNSDLVVFQYGANDTLNYGKSLETYGQRIGVVLDRVREAIPDVSCVVIGPLDRLVRSSKGLHSPYVVRKVALKQREVALAKGCAFWDGQMGMGGRGSMKWFLKHGLALKDMVHLQPKGGAIVAKRFAAALDAALSKY